MQEAEAMFNQEMAISNSPLRFAMNKMASQYDAVYNWNGLDPLIYVEFQGVQAYSGKGGIAFFGETQLLPIYVNFPGTGLINELVGWIILEDVSNLDIEERTLSIESIRKFELFQN